MREEHDSRSVTSNDLLMAYDMPDYSMKIESPSSTVGSNFEAIDTVPQGSIKSGYKYWAPGSG